MEPALRSADLEGSGKSLRVTAGRRVMLEQGPCPCFALTTGSVLTAEACCWAQGRHGTGHLCPRTSAVMSHLHVKSSFATFPRSCVISPHAQSHSDRWVALGKLWPGLLEWMGLWVLSHWALGPSQDVEGAALPSLRVSFRLLPPLHSLPVPPTMAPWSLMECTWGHSHLFWDRNVGDTLLP